MITHQELLDNYDYNPVTGDFFKVLKTGRVVKAGWDTKGYLRIRFKCKTYSVHRLAWMYVHGEMPHDQIDHINHATSDNRMCNMRIVTHEENSKNRRLRRDNKSGVTGVFWIEAQGKWMASIRTGGKSKHLGLFILKDDAVEARQRADIEYGYHSNHGSPVRR